MRKGLAEGRWVIVGMRASGGSEASKAVSSRLA